MLRENAKAVPGEVEPQPAPPSQAPDGPRAPSRPAARDQNRVLGLALASVAAFVFVAAIILAVLLHHVEIH